MQHQDATAQTAAVVALLGDVLGSDLIGAYLHGSAVLGQLRRSSDVDVLAVARRTLMHDERRALLAGLLELSGSSARSGPARPVELSVVVQREVRPWRFPPTADFCYGEWLRADYQRGVVPERAPTPDLAVLLTMVLQGGAALLGPPPAEVLDPVPLEDACRAAVGHIPQLLEDLHSDARNVVLTLARIWTTVATGRVVAKDVAADWVLDRLPNEHRPVLVRAREAYLTRTYAEDAWDELRSRLEPHCAYVVAEIEACVRR